jgi:hypothetical protein
MPCPKADAIRMEWYAGKCKREKLERHIHFCKVCAEIYRQAAEFAEKTSNPPFEAEELEKGALI